MAASKDDKEGLDKMVMMNTRLVGLCASHDSVVKDQDKMAEAAEVYRCAGPWCGHTWGVGAACSGRVVGLWDTEG